MNYAYIDPGTGMTIASFSGWLIAALAALAGLFGFFFKRIFRFFKNNKKLIIIIICVVISGAVITGILMIKKEADFDRKFIIIGFDGLSPEIVESMMSEGKLPNFQKLSETGSYSRLSTTNPSQSPVAWSGFATGRNPGKNGVFDFIVRDPKAYSLSLSLSNFRGGKPRRVIKGPCFWDYTSKKRIPTIILGCPVTFPPDKVYGKMLSGMGVPDILGTEGTFSFYTTEKENKEKDIGGTVFQIRNQQIIVTHLVGPKKGTPGKKAENVKVPFKIKPLPGEDSVDIEFQNQKFTLKQGKWSDWKNVSFNLGIGREMDGIVKFYLVEARPEIKLYATPINFDPRNPYFAVSYPGEYSNELATEIGLFYTQGMPVDTWAVNEKRITEQPHLEQLNEVFREKQAMLDYELARFEKGVLFAYFESSDIVQHMFWRYTDKDHPLYDKDAPEEYTNMIRSWYIRMDSILGGVMGKIGEDDLIIVLSDHGFNTFRRAVNLNTWLRQNGYLELKDPYAETGQELLKDVDWSETRAYSIGFGAVYVNQEGREKEGIVKRGKESERLKEEISGKLKDWTDEKYDQKVISQVYSGENIFSGKYSDLTPDLYVGFNIGYRASWQTALGAVPEGIIEDNLKKWSGSHLFDPDLVPGILLANKKITKKGPSIYDITPTILKEIGYDNESLLKLDLDGAPLF